VTCHRFGQRRPVAAAVDNAQVEAKKDSAHQGRAKAATDQSGDKAPHSKERSFFRIEAIFAVVIRGTPVDDRSLIFQSLQVFLGLGDVPQILLRGSIF